MAIGLGVAIKSKNPKSVFLTVQTVPCTVEIHEGPFPTAFRRGLDTQEVNQQMWLQDENYISRELFTHPYFVLEPVGNAAISR